MVCCSAAYIVALLHDGFKLGMHERRLRFTNYVEDPQGNSMDIDWTLGTILDSAVRLHLSQDYLLKPYHNPLEHKHCQSFKCSITYRRMLATSICLCSKT